MSYIGGPYRAKPFLRRERRMEIPCELHQGYACPLILSANRQRISENLRQELRKVALDRFPELYVGNRRVLPDRNSLYYPDIIIVQGQVEFLDALHDVVVNPTVVIHVTGRSREFFDRGDRIQSYQDVDSLQGIHLISEDQVMVETFRRQPGGSWFQGVTSSRKAKLRVRAVDVEIPLSAIYEGGT
jgi:hypothetical protein